MKIEEKIGHYALLLQQQEMALSYAKRHLNLVEKDIEETKKTIKELKQRNK